MDKEIKYQLKAQLNQCSSYNKWINYCRNGMASPFASL